MPRKRCAWAMCKNDTKDKNKDHMQGITFYPFPKPKTQLERCKEWIRLCNRPYYQLNVEKIGKHHYVCSKHFTDGFIDLGPVSNHHRFQQTTKRKAPTKNSASSSKKDSPPHDEDTPDKLTDSPPFKVQCKQEAFEEENFQLQDMVVTSAVTLDKDIWEAMPTSTTTDLAEQQQHQSPSQSQCHHQTLQSLRMRMVDKQQPVNVKAEPPDDSENLANPRLTTQSSEEKDDEFDVIGKNLALKLRKLPHEQRIHAEKLFADVIYEAELGNLSRQSMLLARPPSHSQGTHLLRSETDVPFVVSLR